VESHIRYGYQKRCPDLYWDAGTGCYRCRLAEDPEQGEHFRYLLGVGHGCCAPLNAWRTAVRQRDEPDPLQERREGSPHLPPRQKHSRK
jgi:hypothetical protein